MSIEFGSLDTIDVEGALHASVRVSGILSSVALAEGEGIMLARMRLGGAGAGVQAGAGGPSVVTPSTMGTNIGITGAMAASLDITAQLNVSIPMRAVLFGGDVAANDTPGYMVGGMELGTTGFAEVPNAEAFAFLVAPPPHLTIYGGIFFERVDEAVATALDGAGIPLIGLRERAEFLWSGITALEGIASLTESVAFDDAMAVILRELVNAGFEFGGDVTDNYTAIGRVTDALRMTGVATTQLEARNAIIVSLAVQALADMFAKEQLTDGIAFDVAAAQVLVAMQRLVETIEAEATQTDTMTLAVMLADSVALTAEPGSVLEAHEALRAGVAFSLRLALDSGQYVAYVMNTASKGLTSYENYPFNSFLQFGDAEYGMTPDGIRRLGGPDDDGDAINARFRLAFTNLGTSALKRMRAAYLGLSSTGDLRLKVIIVNPKTRQREAHWYRLRSTPSGGPMPVRLKIGEGLRTVYWGFEIETIDGAQFEIDMLQLLPIILEERMDGEGGGKR